MSNDMTPDGMKGMQRREAEDEDVEGHKLAQRRATEELEAEGLARRAVEDEDVEGHGLARAVEPEGVASPRTRLSEDEDVEGHGMQAQRRLTEEPEGDEFVRSRVEDEDVEGHGLARAVEPEGILQRRETEDEDVEGHGIAMRSPSSRGE